MQKILVIEVGLIAILLINTNTTPWKSFFIHSFIRENDIH